MIVRLDYMHFHFPIGQIVVLAAAFLHQTSKRDARIFGAQSAKHLADQNDDIFYEDAKRRYGLWYMNIGYKWMV